MDVRGFDAFYGESQVLRNFSVTVEAGRVLCLLGRNGAGKTTALKAIMGIVKPKKGDLILNGENLSGLPPHEIPRRGIGYVPQGRRLFAELTVRENLDIGLMTRKTGKAALEHALSYFPVLRERMDQVSGTLSGGEQTMLAIARALCLEPSVLMLDEPTEGLMPSMIAAIRDVVLKLRENGVAILLVEQNARAALNAADRAYVMELGEITMSGRAADLANDPQIERSYLGLH